MNYTYSLERRKLKKVEEIEVKNAKLSVDFMADLHLDFYLNDEFNIAEFFYKYISPEGSIAVVAGDISHSNKVSKDFLERLSELYRYVLVIPGNHDWYFQKEGENRYTDLIKSVERENVIFLFDEVEVFEYKGVKFAGAMMMYNLNEDVSFYTWRALLNDHKFIPRDFAKQRNSEEVNYYNKVIDKVDVFVSHIPIVNLDGLNTTENLFLNVDVSERKDVLYVSGHTHKRKSSLEQEVDYEGINVSFGYPSETNNREVVSTVIFID